MRSNPASAISRSAPAHSCGPASVTVRPFGSVPGNGRAAAAMGQVCAVRTVMRHPFYIPPCAQVEPRSSSSPESRIFGAPRCGRSGRLRHRSVTARPRHGRKRDVEFVVDQARGLVRLETDTFRVRSRVFAACMSSSYRLSALPTDTSPRMLVSITISTASSRLRLTRKTAVSPVASSCVATASTTGTTP